MEIIHPVEQHYNYIPQPEKQFRYSVIQVSIWAGLLLLGLVLKLQHWPGNALSILLGTAGLTAYNFVAFLLMRGKHTLNNILLGAGVLWMVVLLWGFAFNNGHPYNEMGLMIYFGAILLVGTINALVYRKYFGKSV